MSKTGTERIPQAKLAALLDRAMKELETINRLGNESISTARAVNSLRAAICAAEGSEG